MALSQILLTGFVVYWLIGQYKGEREDLQQQLFYEFMEAQNKAMDSTLYGFLHPILIDSLFTTPGLGDSVMVSAEFTPGGSIGDHIIQIGINDTTSHTLSLEGTHTVSRIATQEVLLKGVKMIIKMSADSANGPGIFGSHALPELDSVLLLNLVSDRLKGIDHQEFRVIWYQDSQFDPHQNANKRIRFESFLSKPAMVFEVTNFEPLLLREISNQILFAIFLLLLTASAFYLSIRSLKRQELLNSLRNEFISNVSHELKTPVSTVKVALEALQNFDLKKDAAVSDEYLKMAALEMDRLDLLIQKILNQSLLESEQVVINREKSDLIELTNTVIQTLNPRLRNLNAKIELQTSVESAFVQIDHLFVQGVLINLLDNALKYGGEPPEIIVSIAKHKGRIALSVLDNGSGIDKQFHDKVFERFFRVPTGDRHNVKGYGLGLSFAAQVMKQHGGSIELKNSDEGGCLFTIYFQA